MKMVWEDLPLEGLGSSITDNGATVRRVFMEKARSEVAN